MSFEALIIGLGSLIPVRLEEAESIQISVSWLKMGGYDVGKTF